MFAALDGSFPLPFLEQPLRRGPARRYRRSHSSSTERVSLPAAAWYECDATGQRGGSEAVGAPPTAAPSKRRTGQPALAPRPVAREGGGRGGNHRVVPSSEPGRRVTAHCSPMVAARSRGRRWPDCGASRVVQSAGLCPCTPARERPLKRRGFSLALPHPGLAPGQGVRARLPYRGQRALRLRRRCPSMHRSCGGQRLVRPITKCQRPSCSYCDDGPATRSKPIPFHELAYVSGDVVRTVSTPLPGGPRDAERIPAQAREDTHRSGPAYAAGLQWSAKRFPLAAQSRR